MSRRKDYKMKKIRKLNIGATIVASLFATVFLVFWILFSLLSYMTNLFQAKIDATASNLKTYNEIVDHYFSTGISDAKNYSVLLGDYLTDPSSSASFYQSLKDYQLASNYEEIGILSIDGMGVSSRNSN